MTRYENKLFWWVTTVRYYSSLQSIKIIHFCINIFLCLHRVALQQHCMVSSSSSINNMIRQFYKRYQKSGDNLWKPSIQNAALGRSMAWMVESLWKAYGATWILALNEDLFIFHNLLHISLNTALEQIFMIWPLNTRVQELLK